LLIVTTEPSTASITVDGKRQAVGPVELEVTAGNHVIVANGDGLVQQRLSIHVNAGERVRVPIQMASMPRPRPTPRARPVPDDSLRYPARPSAAGVAGEAMPRAFEPRPSVSSAPPAAPPAAAPSPAARPSLQLPPP